MDSLSTSILILLNLFVLRLIATSITTTSPAIPAPMDINFTTGYAYSIASVMKDTSTGTVAASQLPVRLSILL